MEKVSKGGGGSVQIEELESSWTPSIQNPLIHAHEPEGYNNYVKQFHDHRQKV